MPSELATFRGDDDPRLVAASMACPVCLSGRVAWSLNVGEWGDGQAHCCCEGCGHIRTVSLTWEQALRLSLQPGSPVPA